PGRVCRHYLEGASNQEEGADLPMEPDRDDLPAEQAGRREARTWAAQPSDTQVRGAQPGDAQLRDAQLREAQLREAWRRRSLATGWRTPDDWPNAAVDEVLSGCRNRAPAPRGGRPGRGRGW